MKQTQSWVTSAQWCPLYGQTQPRGWTACVNTLPSFTLCDGTGLLTLHAWKKTQVIITLSVVNMCPHHDCRWKHARQSRGEQCQHAQCGSVGMMMSALWCVVHSCIPPAQILADAAPMPSWHSHYSYCTYLWYRIITKGTSIRGWLRGRLLLHATLATMGVMPIVGRPGTCHLPPNISRIWQTWGMAPQAGVPTRAPTPNPLQLTGGRMGELAFSIQTLQVPQSVSWGPVQMRTLTRPSEIPATSGLTRAGSEAGCRGTGHRLSMPATVAATSVTAEVPPDVTQAKGKLGLTVRVS